MASDGFLAVSPRQAPKAHAEEAVSTAHGTPRPARPWSSPAMGAFT